MLPSNELFVRPAKREDCFEIARLFLMASDGLAEYIWSQMAEPGESLIEAGARRCSGEAIACSYQNCFIAELANTPVGMLNSFAMEERDCPDDLRADPVLQPFVELRDYGSLFVSGVAVYPEHRGHRIGTRLLATAEQQALSYGLPRLSLICLEQNQGATRLYSRTRFPRNQPPTARSPSGLAVEPRRRRIAGKAGGSRPPLTCTRYLVVPDARTPVLFRSAILVARPIPSASSASTPPAACPSAAGRRGSPRRCRARGASAGAAG